MRLHLQLATASLLLLITGAAVAMPTQTHFPQLKRDKKQTEDLQWLWQYATPAPAGNENGLTNDPRFLSFLKQHLTAPQTFWGDPGKGRPYDPLAETALNFLSTPGKVIADDNRYLTIDGCVPHFCPDRGLLFIDLGALHPLVAFAAIDWIKENKTPDQSEAEYTLWLFANRVLNPDRIPSALVRSIARWTAEPLADSKTIEHITNAILVDPDGQPHQVAPAAVGANTITRQQTDQKAHP
jgi:hypothetical protein